MATVQIIPLPAKCRKIPEWCRPGHPPIFPDCGDDGPTTEDVALARDLFLALDSMSQDWYRRNSGLFADLPPRARSRAKKGSADLPTLPGVSQEIWVDLDGKYGQ